MCLSESKNTTEKEEQILHFNLNSLAGEFGYPYLTASRYATWT